MGILCADRSKRFNFTTGSFMRFRGGVEIEDESVLLVTLGRFAGTTGKWFIFLGLMIRFRLGDAGTGFKGALRTGDVRRLFSVVVLGDKIFGDAAALGDTSEPI